MKVLVDNRKAYKFSKEYQTMKKSVFNMLNHVVTFSSNFIVFVVQAREKVLHFFRSFFNTNVVIVVRILCLPLCLFIVAIV